MKEEKQQIADIDRSVYDIKDLEDDFYKIDAGLTPALVEQISKEKNDPEWMKEFRLHSLEIYNKLQVPDWGPSIEGLHIFIIVTSSLIRFCVENFNSFDKSDNTLIYRISVPSSIFDESDFNCARLSSDTSIISASFYSSSVVFTSKRFLKYHMKSFTN